MAGLLRLGRPRVSVVPFAPPVAGAGRRARHNMHKAFRAYERAQEHPVRSAVAWGTWDLLSWLRRYGWAHRYGLAPLYTAAFLQAAGAVLASAPQGYATALALAALGGTGMAWWLHGLNPVAVFRRGRVQTRPPRRRGVLTRRRTIWTWTLYAGMSAWLTAAAAHGAGPPMPGLMLVGVLGWGPFWWWHHRARAVPGYDPRFQMWDDFVACDGGPIAHSVLSELTPIHAKVLTAGIEPAGGKQPPGEIIGWTGIANLPKGKLTTSRAMTKVEDVASAAELDPQSVVLEPTNPPKANRVRVSVYEHNPLLQVIPWPGPHLFNWETGVMPIAVHPDAELAHYRFYKRGSGPVHDLIAGTTDAGKSRTVDELLATERHSTEVPMVSFVIDPQEGASLPEWQDQPDGTRRVHGYARNTAEGLVLLSAIKAEMLARNKFIASYRWVDELGRDRYGLDHFDPVFWATRPDPSDRLALLCMTIDEAHAILNGGGKDDAEDIAKMARKCGIKLRLVVHVPLLDQLGSSTTLRDMVKAGNVIVMRTSTPLTAQVAFSGRLPVDPVSIPIENPDGSSTAGMCYILGPGARPAPARMWLCKDPHHWATSGELTPFVPLSRELASWMEGSRAARPATASTVVDLHSAPSAPTVGDRIVEHLAGLAHDKPIEIAKALCLDSAAVSSTLTRLEKAGRAHKVRSGWWAAGPAAVTDEGERADTQGR